MAKRWSNEEIAAALKASAQEIKPKGKLPAKIEIRRHMTNLNNLSTSYPAYVYQTTDTKIVIVVPTDMSIDVYAAQMPSFLRATDFNLTRTENAKTLREMRAAARDAGVKLRGNTCAHVHDHSRINALEP